MEAVAGAGGVEDLCLLCNGPLVTYAFLAGELRSFQPTRITFKANRIDGAEVEINVLVCSECSRSCLEVAPGPTPEEGRALAVIREILAARYTDLTFPNPDAPADSDTDEDP